METIAVKEIFFKTPRPAENSIFNFIRFMKIPRTKSPVRFSSLLALAALMAAGGAHRAVAATFAWTGASGTDTNWSTPANWSPSGPPTSADTAVFGNDGVALDGLTINNVVDVSTNISALTYSNNVSGQWHNTQIPAGVTLTVSGATLIGATGVGVSTAVTISGDGTLVANGSFSVTDSAGGSSDSRMSLDMSGLAAFTNNASATTMAIGTGTQNPATLSLASNSFINVATVNIETTGGSNGRHGNLYLGPGTNSILASNINISTGKGQSSTIQFTNSTGTVYIGGTGGGTARANMLFGNGTSGSAVCNGQLLLAGHLANVLAGTITLGGSGGSDSGTGDAGIVTFDHGTFDVTSILMGNTKTSSSGKSTSGTFTVGGDPANTATLIVNSPSGPGGGNLVLGNTTTVNESGAGTLNVNQNGIAQIYCPITKANASQNTATISITTGTLTMISNVIGNASVPIDNFNVTDSTLNLPVGLTPEVYANTLTAAGTANTINVSSVPMFFEYPAQFPIISYAVPGGDNSTFVAGTIPGGFSGYISNNTTTSTIDLVITNGPALITLKSINWNGLVGSTPNGNWDTTTKNWLTNSVQTNFFQGDFVTFDDTLAGTTNVVLTTALTPSSLTVNNTLSNYLFTGLGKISGATGLTKNGNGTLILDNAGANDFVGAVVINGGTLQIGNNDANGNLPPGDVQDNGTLTFAHTNDISFTNALSGSGSLSQIGTGKLIVGAANSYSGNTTVRNGTLALNGAGTISASGLTFIANGGTLDVSAQSATSISFNSLAMTNGTLILVTNTANASTMSLTNSTISLVPDVNAGIPPISATTLALGGATNYFNIPVVLNVPASPTLPIVIPLLSYTSLSGNFNFGIALPNAYITNDTTLSQIEVVFTQLPYVVTWNGGSSTDNYWSDAANWSGTAIAPSDSLVFDGTTRLNNTNDTASLTAYTNITFNSTAGAFTLNGNPVTGANITNNSANPQTIDLGLVFGTDISVNGGTAGLIIGGGLTNTIAGSSSTTITLAGNGLLTNLFASTITAGGTNLLSLNDPNGTWSLMDNASATPITVPWALNVNNGTFNFGSASSAPVLTSTTVNGHPTDNQIGIGTSATATLNISNGTFTTSARVNTGTATGATGNINVYGGTFNIGNQFQGANGSAFAFGTFNMNGGTVNDAGEFYVASRGTGTLTMNGGLFTCTRLDVSRNAAGNTAGSIGTVALNGGILGVTSVTTVSANSQSGGSPTATFNFNGGILQARASSTTFFKGGTTAPAPPVTAYVQAGGAIVDTTNFNITIAEPLQHDPNLVAADGGLIKFGSGTLTLSAGNTYTGPTDVREGTLFVSGSLDVTSVSVSNNATLAGTGSLGGSVLVKSGGTLSPAGANAIGVLSVSGAVTLQGTTFMEVNRDTATSDLLSASSISYGGTLIIANLGSALQAGDQFTLFSAPSLSGSFTVSGPAGVQWDTSQLASNGSIKVISVVNTTPTNILASVSGNTLTLSWPADHIGWRLQAQTNSISTGLGSNWVDVTGSTSVNSENFTINPANGSVFFRMVYP
jgi:fibronectin-binding autotransporter adhesin